MCGTVDCIEGVRMRKVFNGVLLLAAVVLMSGGMAFSALAYGPGVGYDWFYSSSYRGGPGVNYDYGLGRPGSYDYGAGPSGTYDYGGPSGTQGNAQVSSDNTVRAYPGFNTNVPDTSSYEFDPNYWWDWDEDDDWDDDWWYYSGGPGAEYGQGWRYSPNGWWFQLYGGSWLSNGWQLIHSRWYRFDASGYMVTGWFSDGDGNKYYLNPIDDGTLGMMRTGWQVIDGKSYYFNTQSDGTMGRLFVNTTTPDGYVVGADGALIQ